MKETFNLIEEITRNDNSIYFELGNITHNGRSEYAAEHGYIKSVRILKMKIARSSYVEKLENYINEHYQLLPLEYDGCLLYTSPSPRDKRQSRMPSSA